VMKKFEILTSTCVPLPIENVDTDQIIPARFLKSITRDGFGDNLFRDWRFNANDEPIENFVLNDTDFSGQVLVTGRNFGCGSSREHAAWAISSYGFNAVVLPVQISEVFLSGLFTEIQTNSKTKVLIDLPNQTIEIKGLNLKEHFEIYPYKKHCLINGLDDIDFLREDMEEIKRFEKEKSIY
jgi:3-isopropylmalate/(R)-2-methylmalate dehydratase small subunit